MNKYVIVWMLMPPKVGFVAALGAKEPIYLPVFLAGENLAIFERGEGSQFNSLTLLYGVLHGSSIDPSGLDLALTESYYPKILRLLVPELQMPNVEELILTAGAMIRKDFGSGVSARLLKTGIKLVPDSSKIRSDYILDLWVAASDRNDPNYVAVFYNIVAILKTLDYAQIAPAVRKCMAYIAAFSLLEIVPEEVDQYMDDNFNAADLEWNETINNHYAEYKVTGQFFWKALDADSDGDGADKEKPTGPVATYVLFGEQSLRF